jgi:hypothetical protein
MDFLKERGLRTGTRETNPCSLQRAPCTWAVWQFIEGRMSMAHGQGFEVEVEVEVEGLKAEVGERNRAGEWRLESGF